MVTLSRFRERKEQGSEGRESKKATIAEEDLIGKERKGKKKEGNVAAKTDVRYVGARGRNI